MADEGRGRELPQRVRDEARAATSPSAARAAPVFSAELRQRLKAAVTAERSGAAARAAGVTQEPPRVPNAGPVTEDEVTEWYGTAGKSPEAAPPPGATPPGAAAKAGAGSASDAEPESVSWLGAGLAALIVIPALVIGSLAVVAVRHFTGAPKSARSAPPRPGMRRRSAGRRPCGLPSR